MSDRRSFIDSVVDTLVMLAKMLYVFAVVAAVFLVFTSIFLLIRKLLDYTIYKLTGRGIVKPYREPRNLRFNDSDSYAFAGIIGLTCFFFFMRYTESQKHKYDDVTVHAETSSNSDNNYSQQAMGYYSNKSSDTTTAPVAVDTIVKENIQTQSVDSIPLLREWKLGEKPGYYISENLPLSYSHKNLKFTFYKVDTLIKVKCYDEGELYNTYTCNVDNNNLAIQGGDGFFSFSDGKLTLVYPSQHLFYPLSMSR